MWSKGLRACCWRESGLSDVPEADELSPTADIAEADVLDHGVCYLGVTIEQRAEHLGSCIVQPGGDEFATATAAERGANSVDENDIAGLHEGGSCCRGGGTDSSDDPGRNRTGYRSALLPPAFPG